MTQKWSELPQKTTSMNENIRLFIEAHSITLTNQKWNKERIARAAARTQNRLLTQHVCMYVCMYIYGLI